MEAGGVRRFFNFQVLNGAILALFFHFFTFSTEKVGIVGAFLEKKEKSRNTFKRELGVPQNTCVTCPRSFIKLE